MLKDLLPSYGIEPRKFCLRKGGFNRNFIVEASQGIYFVKERKGRNASNRSSTDAEISCFLHPIIGTANPIRNKDGHFTTNQNGSSYTVFEFLDGEDYREEEFLEFAEVLRRFHSEMRSYNGTLFNGNDALKQSYELIDAMPQFGRYLDSILKDMEGQEKTIIHSDLHAGNAKFRNGKLIPFDFEFSHEDYRIFDVANTLICLAALNPYELDYTDARSFIRRCELDMKKAGEFVRKYGIDAKALPSALQLAWISWSLYTFKNLECSEETRRASLYFPEFVEQNKQRIERL